MPVYLLRLRDVMRTVCEATSTSSSCMPGIHAKPGLRHGTAPLMCLGLACSIFEDEAVAELLTTGKLSELAVLTLYLM
jgi:hypothetical protein